MGINGSTHAIASRPFTTCYRREPQRGSKAERIQGCAPRVCCTWLVAFQKSVDCSTTRSTRVYVIKCGKLLSSKVPSNYQCQDLQRQLQGPLLPNSVPCAYPVSPKQRWWPHHAPPACPACLPAALTRLSACGGHSGVQDLSQSTGPRQRGRTLYLPPVAQV